MAVPHELPEIPEAQPSGVEWLGEVPEHSEVTARLDRQNRQWVSL
jgi:hypothetical protein